LFKILFLLFISIPLIEIYLLIQIGASIGAATTVILCIFTAALGAFLVRLQGLHTIAKVKQSMDRGELPAVTLLEGLMLLLTGVLLLTPGFFTDVIGFLCLVPAFRSKLANSLLKGYIEPQYRQRNERQAALEGEFWEEDP
jgi:UPF0716 protein FxsA